MDEDLILNICLKYQPVLYFYKTEKYFPVNLEDYIVNCTLNKNKEVILDTINDPLDIVNTDVDAGLDPTLGNNKSYYLQLKDTASNRNLRYGAVWKIKGSSMNKTLYPQDPNSHVFVMNVEHELEGHFMDISYVYNYSYNGTLAPHYFDAECITIRLQVLDDAEPTSTAVVTMPRAVALSAHGSNTWYSWEGIQKYKTTQRPVLYVAKGSHAFYTKPGTNSRFFFFGSEPTNAHWLWEDYPLLLLSINPDQIKPEYQYVNFVGTRTGNNNERFQPKHQTNKLNTLNWWSKLYSLTHINQLLEKHKIIIWVLGALMSLSLAAFSYMLPGGKKTHTVLSRLLLSFVVFLASVSGTLLFVFVGNQS